MRFQNIMNRRKALAAVASTAAAIVTARPAIGAAAAHTGHRDAELLDLGRQHDALAAKLADAFRRSAITYDGAEAALPPPPEVLRMHPEDVSLGLRLDGYEYNREAPGYYDTRDVWQLKEQAPFTVGERRARIMECHRGLRRSQRGLE